MTTRRTLLAGLALLASPPVLAQPGVNQPQPKLPMERLVILGHDGTRHEFQVEMAISSEQQMVGLMFRPTVAAHEGMLFDWGSPRPSSMWMRNTIASLDMVFINADGRIRRIAENTVPQSLTPVDSGGPVRATLELQAGITEKLDIRVGDRVLHPIFGATP